MKIASKIGDKWFRIGIDLGFSNDSLSNMKADHISEGVIMTAYHMLQQWKRGTSDVSKQEEMYSALRKAGFHGLAKNLEDLQPSTHDSSLLLEEP